MLRAAPKAVTIQETELQSAQDTELSTLRGRIHQGDWNKSPPAYKAVRYERSVLEKLILRETRIVVLENLLNQILDLAHEGHQGEVKTPLKRIVAWDGQRSQTQVLVMPWMPLGELAFTT